MADIEDLHLDISIEERPTNSAKLVFPKRKHRVNINADSQGESNCSVSCVDSTIPSEEMKSAVPGTQTVWLKTFGCSHNVSDSEYMEGLLASYGYNVVASAEDAASPDGAGGADIWVLNSCTVKDPSQASFLHLVQKAKAKGVPVVVAGCVPQADRSIPDLQSSENQVVSVVGIQQIDRIVEVVEQALNGNSVKLLGKKTLPRLDLPKVRKNPLVEIIPLSTVSAQP